MKKENVMSFLLSSVTAAFNLTKFYSKPNFACLKKLRNGHAYFRNNSTVPSSKPVLHKVIVSQSKDIFENLALEEWLYRHLDFEECSYLLMWRNHSTVVIGRHQNAWKETNIPLLQSAGAALARRYSGGGAVYHDLGNINFSFLTSRKQYDRKWNLNVVVSALYDRWMLDLSVNKRDCIMWNNLYKVSGTASRYDSKRAYHHFTLLLDVDKTHLNTLLQPCLSGIVGNPATASIPASTVNLKEIEDELTFDNVVECVGDYFISKGLPNQRAGIQYVEPTEDKRYPGLHTIVSELRDWTWVYGKTPAFSLYRKFCLDLPTGKTTLELSSYIKDGVITKLQFTSFPLHPQLELIAAKLCDRIESQRLCQRQLDSLLNELQLTQPGNSITSALNLNKQIISGFRKLLLE